VGDFGRNKWEWLGIWLLRISAAQTSSPLRDLLVIEHNLDVIRCGDWAIDQVQKGPIRAARSWWRARLRRWRSIPPAIRAGISSRF